jgi:ABC-2 type transport system permease protein
MTPKQPSWLGIKHGFISGLNTIVGIKAIRSTMILAVLLYGFFYPAAYHSQVASQLPIVVVDQDQSALSRQIVVRTHAVHAVQVVEQTPHFAEAVAQVQQRQADAILLIPHGLEASVLRGEEGGLALYVSGAYLIRTREIGYGLSAVISDTVHETLAPYADALGMQPPIQLTEQPLYNPMSGYGSYVVPAVAALIVQQTLLLGMSMLVSAQRQQGCWKIDAGGLIGLILAGTLIGVLSCWYFFGFVFWFQDYPRGGNLIGMLLATPLFVLAVVCLGVLLGSAFDRIERPAQILTFSSVPLFFLTGASWPLSAMPAPLAWGAWLAPSTAGVRVFIQLNQMGSPIMAVWPALAVLLVLMLCFGGWAGWRLLRYSAPAP